MKREYPETPLVGVGAIIIAEDRVVLVKRGHEPLAVPASRLIGRLRRLLPGHPPVEGLGP